jgi:ketosteroid isomerase-like protein
MRKGYVFAGLLAFLMVFCAVHFDFAGGTAAAGAQETTKHAAIRKVLTDQQAAWNRGDVGAFMQGYWNAPELSFAGSTGFVRGWEKVTVRYKNNYPDEASMGKLDFSDLEVRTLGADAALVLGKWQLKRASGDVGGIFTLVLQRFPDGWKIVHDHTSVVANPAP